jgi:Sec-independent protein translocase protein TatA
MALFSDIDWVIILGVAAFFLFGQKNGEILRNLGRYYGRAMRLKQELLSEFTEAAQLPANLQSRSLSIRQVVLGYDGEGRPSGVPVAVTSPPVGVRPLVDPHAYAPALAGGTWSMALASSSLPPPEST